jgi:hypothetical protein
MAGVLSLSLVLLVVVGPMWLAERLEMIETAGLMRTEDVVTEENTTTSVSYVPYKDFNSTDAVNFCDIGPVSWNGGDDSTLSLTYDVDGYKDLLIPSETLYIDDKIIFNFWYRPDVLQTQGIYDFRAYIKMPTIDTDLVKCELDHIYIVEVDVLGNYWDKKGLCIDTPVTGTLYNEEIVGGGVALLDAHGKAVKFPKETYINLTFSDERYNYDQAWPDFDNHYLYLSMRWVLADYNIPAGYSIYSSHQWHPEYYEETETTTTYTNTTGTVWVPYMQKITTYKCHKVGMALGGALILVTALIVSPLPIGEAFDGVFPINNFSASNRKRTKSYRRKRRRR